jgi:DNA polymerase-3 subunit alpha
MYCKEKGIKYLHGIEIYLTETLNEKVRDNFHTILIARNFEGFKELNLLIDLSTQPDHFYYKNRISFDEFLNISDNIIKISACLASPLSRLSDENPYLKKLLKKYDYYEIQYHPSNDQMFYNLKLYEWSKQYKKQLISGTDTHSLNKYKAECRSVLQKSKKIEYTDEDQYDLTYKSYDELVQLFDIQKCLPKEIYLQAIKNTNVMADSVMDFDLDTSFKYPKLYDNEEEVFFQRIESFYNNKLKNNIITNDQIYLDNIAEEKRVLSKIGMSGFILFMSELTTWCRENNIPFGNCRGSVGGSTIAYILDIIDLNPVTWKTVFSRFANEDRVEIGDIDIDFSPSQRELVYQYIINRFGIDYTSYILAIGTISDKGTIDEIGRALHYNWIKNNQDKKETESPYHFKKMMAIKSEYDSNPEKAKEKYPDLFYYFDGLLNTCISQSMHPAGIIASPVSLPDNYGTFWNEGKRIISINMEEVHEVSLVKYDILGLKNIEIIKDTCELIGKKYPLSHEVNWNDEKVWEDIITSNVGIFQFEGHYAFDLLKRYQPKKINDLSLINSALRPSGASFRDRLIAKEFNKNPSEQIDELLKDNNGFLVFQEDVLAFLQKICGLSGSEADNVRRAIGRKQADRLEQALPAILEGYCNISDKPREIAESEAKEFLKIIEDASSYMFGYNHSTGYSMIGYLCAYFRYYHPLEFITAYLNNAQNQDDINDGTELAKTKGIKIQPVEFGYSRSNYYPNKENNSIYKGLSSIKGFGEKVDISNEMLQFKDNQYDLFTNLLIDIKEKTTIGNSKIEILIKLNYFKKFGRNKKLLDIFTEFTSGNNRYDKKHKDATKQKRIQALYEFEQTVEDIALPIFEQVAFESILLGTPMSTYELPKGTCFIVELDLKNSPKAQVYGLSTGVLTEVKVQKAHYNKLPFKQNDVVQFLKLKKKPKVKYTGEDENHKPIFEPIDGEWDIWALSDDKKEICYKIINSYVPK